MSKGRTRAGQSGTDIPDVWQAAADSVKPSGAPRRGRGRCSQLRKWLRVRENYERLKAARDAHEWSWKEVAIFLNGLGIRKEKAAASGDREPLDGEYVRQIAFQERRTHERPRGPHAVKSTAADIYKAPLSTIHPKSKVVRLSSLDGHEQPIERFQKKGSSEEPNYVTDFAAKFAELKSKSPKPLVKGEFTFDTKAGYQPSKENENG